MTYASQRLRLLRALRSGRWVSMPKLIRQMGGYRLSARVWELRRQGFIIVWREKYRGRTRLTEYRLKG